MKRLLILLAALLIARGVLIASEPAKCSDMVPGRPTVAIDFPRHPCPKLTPQPGDMFTITVYVESGDVFTWQILDVYGHWNDVAGVVTPAQVEDSKRFTRLVLGADNLDHNPADYRVNVYSP